MTTIETITAMRNRAWPFLLRRLALRTATAGMLLMLLFVALRRIYGNFTPLAAWQLLALGIGATCLALLWRVAWRSVEGTGPWQVAVERYAPAVALALLALALSIPGTALLALAAFWLLLVGSEVAYGLYGQRIVAGAEPLPTRIRSAEPLESSDETTAEADEEPASLLPPGVSQQITRAADAQGETLESVLRVVFAPGEQTVAAHVAFCPPLLQEPTATVECLEGAPCEAKLTAVEVFGARLELKRRSGVALEDEAIVRLRVVAPTAPGEIT